MAHLVDISSIQIDPEFDLLLHALHPQELEILKESLLQDGWREDEPAIVWGAFLADGHNRYRICKELGITNIPVSPLFLDTKNDVKTWIYRRQIGRRNLSEAMRTLYIGQLAELLKPEVGTAEAVRQLVSTQDRSTRQVYRDIEVNKAFQEADEALRAEFLGGEISAQKLIDALTPPPAPNPILSKEEMAEAHRRAFPGAMRTQAERVILAIENLRTLGADLEIICSNQGVELKDFAPVIAEGIYGKLQDELLECEALTRLVYENGEFSIPENTFE